MSSSEIDDMNSDPGYAPFERGEIESSSAVFIPLSFDGELGDEGVLLPRIMTRDLERVEEENGFDLGYVSQYTMVHEEDTFMDEGASQDNTPQQWGAPPIRRDEWEEFDFMQETPRSS